MNTLQIVFGVILLVMALFLVVAVLMQSGKSKNLSGAIAGGAETFFGKEKGKTWDKMLSKLTTIVSICFVVLVIITYVIQPNTTTDPNKYFNDEVDLSGDKAEETKSEAEKTVESADINGADTEAAE